MQKDKKMKTEKNPRKTAENGKDIRETDAVRYAMTPEIGIAVSYAVTALACATGMFFYYDALVGAFSPSSDPRVFFGVIFAVFLVVGILFLPNWLSRYTFDRRGVRLSVAGKTRKFVAWESVGEVRYIVYGTKPLLFISANPLDGLSYAEIKRIKSQITVICSARTLEAVRNFYKDEIINYPKNSIVV
jgi:hypothetical protein